MASDALMSTVLPRLRAKLASAQSPRVSRLQQRVLGFLDPEMPVGMHHHIKSLWHPERIEHVLAGEPQKVTPVTVEFVPSLDCNFSCGPCTYKGWKERTISEIGRRKMSFETMMVLIDKIESAGVRGLIFTGGGEPFVNPHTLDGLEYSSRKHFDLGIFTNGSLLDQAKIDRLAQIPINFIRISFNTGDPDNYCAFHGIKNTQLFERAKRNIRLLAKALAGKDTYFGLGTIVDGSNVDYMKTVAQFIRQVFDEEGAVNLSYIAFRPVVNYGQIDPNLTAQISREVSEKALRSFEEVKEILDGLPVRPILARDYFGEVSKVDHNLGVQNCISHAWAASVAYDGGVYMCSEFDGDPRFLMGNLMHQTWDEIWGSDQREHVISGIGSCPPVCKIRRTNLLLSALSSEGALMPDEIQEMQNFLNVIRLAGDPGGVNFI